MDESDKPPMQRGRSLSIHTHPVSQMVWGKAFVAVFLSFLSLSVQVFLRDRLGHRYVKSWILAIDAFLLFLLLSPAGVANLMSQPVPVNLETG